MIEMKHCRCDPRGKCPCPGKVHADYDKVRRWPDVRPYLFLTWNDLHQRDDKARKMIATCNLRQVSGTQTEYLASTIHEGWGRKGREPLLRAWRCLKPLAELSNSRVQRPARRAAADPAR